MGFSYHTYIGPAYRVNAAAWKATHEVPITFCPRCRTIRSTQFCPTCGVPVQSTTTRKPLHPVQALEAAGLNEVGQFHVLNEHSPKPNAHFFTPCQEFVSPLQDEFDIQVPLTGSSSASEEVARFQNTSTKLYEFLLKHVSAEAISLGYYVIGYVL